MVKEPKATNENAPEEDDDLPEIDPIVTYIMDALRYGDDVSPNHIAQANSSGRFTCLCAAGVADNFTGQTRAFHRPVH